MKKLLLVILISAATAALGATPTKPNPPQRVNIVLITADDMNFDSTSVYGGPIKNLTPNLDRLASEGMRFQYAYSTVAVCQPVREIMHTGLYPHRNGAMGFFPLKPEVRTLNQQLHDAGYLISMFGKNAHYQPAEKFCVDYEETRITRQPSQITASTKKFLAMARDQKRPFFHHVNCTDPHRPFIGANGPADLAGGEPPSRWIKPEEVTDVPGFLEDLPDIRKELACYYTNVRRLDDCVGAVLKTLKDEGVEENTLVMFYGGDHGMSFPFAKSNDYDNSSRGALIMRWPGVIKPGGVDRDHLVSTLDFTPTLLEAAGLPAIPDMDGRSFLPALKGETLTGWDRVFTFYNQSSGGHWLLVRCIRTKDRSYIWNAWSDGKMEYRAENMNGVTWKAMLAAAATNPEMKARADFYLYRVPEEFYDLTDDPCERKNLIDDPQRQSEITKMRAELLALLQRTGDPLAEAFAHRDKPEILAAAKQKLMNEYQHKPKAKAKGKAKAADKTKPAGQTQTAGKGGKGTKQPVSGSELISFISPETIEAGKPVTVRILHHFPEKEGEKVITVSMLLGEGNERLERKEVIVKGDGEIEVTFVVPSKLSGQFVKFGAFIGKDFKKTPQHIQTASQPVK